MEAILEKKLEFDKSEWKPVKFGDVVKEPKESIKDPVAAGVEYVVGLEHIEPEDIHLRSFNTLEESTTFTKSFKKGDVLFGRRRAYLKKAALAELNGICSGDITVFRAKENLLPELLPFIVNNNKFFDWAIKHSAGGLSPRVKFKDLAKYEFLLPPKDQQAQIAELLWALDELQNKQRKLQHDNNALFLSYSKSIYSGNYGKYVELKKIGKLIMGQSPSGKSYNQVGDGMAFLQGNAEFGDKYPSFVKYTSEPKKIVSANTILISVRAPVGDLNIADREYCIGRGLAGLYIEDAELRDYVFNFLKFARFELERNSTGSTFKAINKDILSNLKLVIPAERILKENAKKLNLILKNQKDINSSILTSFSLQKSLINQIF